MIETFTEDSSARRFLASTTIRSIIDLSEVINFIQAINLNLQKDQVKGEKATHQQSLDQDYRAKGSAFHKRLIFAIYNQCFYSIVYHYCNSRKE